MVLWHNVLDVAALNAYTNFTALHGWCDQCTAAIHQGAGQRACLVLVLIEAHGGHAPPPKAYYRGNRGMWDQKTKRSHHPATGGHQTGGPSEEEEVQDLPSCQRAKSQQLA